MAESKIIKLKTLNAPISIIKAGYSNGSHNLQMMLEDSSLYFTFQGASESNADYDYLDRDWTL